jgi:Tol biopolymer transport system component/DNA-binding winged helix-turn-helix (wHTH) protein
MALSAQPPRQVRFGEFELDLQTAELGNNGHKFIMQEQPFQVLVVLLEHPGQLVTREEMRRRLWPSGTFVDFDLGLNRVVNRLRQTLGDSADHPRFIETLPRKGYRFIEPVTAVADSSIDGAAKNAVHEPAPNQAGFVSSPSPLGSQNLAAGSRENHGFRLRWTSVVAVSSIVGLTVVVSSFLIWRSQTQNSMKVLSFVRLTNDGHRKSGCLRTDGTRIYTTEYLAESQSSLAQVSIRGGETTSFPSLLREPRVADISPDGTELLLMNDEPSGPPSVWIQSVVGGNPQRVGELTADDASWGPDEQTITYVKGQEIHIAKKDGTVSRTLLTVPGLPSHLKFSPDGTTLRFTLAEGQDRSTSLWEASADGSHPHPIFRGWSTAGSECCGTWTSGGKYYVFQTWQNGRREIWAIQEHGTALSRARHTPEQVTAGPMDFSYPIAGKNANELLAIGTLPRAEVVRYDLREHRFIPYLSGISAEGLDFSKDGKWVTYTSYPELALWRSRVDGTDRRQLTFPPMRAFLPRWSPDGKQIAFMGGPPGPSWKLGGPWKIYLISAEGGSAQQVLQGETNESDPTWSPDGNSIVFGGLLWPETFGKNHADMNIQVVDLKTHQLSKLPGSDGLCSPRWSPDGRYIVALTSSHPMEPLLFSLATKKWSRLVDRDMGYPSWSRDSRSIYFQDCSYSPPRIVRLNISDHRAEVLMKFSDVKGPMAGFITAWSGVALDGSPLVARNISNQEIYALKLSAP